MFVYRDILGDVCTHFEKNRRQKISWRIMGNIYSNYRREHIKTLTEQLISTFSFHTILPTHYSTVLSFSNKVWILPDLNVQWLLFWLNSFHSCYKYKFAHISSPRSSPPPPSPNLLTRSHMSGWLYFGWLWSLLSGGVYSWPTAVPLPPPKIQCNNCPPWPGDPIEPSASPTPQ